MKKAAVFVAAIFVMSMFGFLASAYEIPYYNSGARAFYVFGPDGDPLMGAEDGTMEIVFEVSENEPGQVLIEVYDPDTGGSFDWRVPGEEWNTTCKFEFYGKTLLASETFGESSEWDNKLYAFGPYDKTQGEKVGDKYRFRLVVKSVSGTNQNLFKVRVSPVSAESYSEKITFRLAPRQGDQMFFYPEVPAGTKSITVSNYDLDVDGGSSTLAVDTISVKHPINDSESGEWRDTLVPISTDTGGRLVYTITKGTQRYANAGLAMKDDKGKALPIYFRRGTPPVAAAPAPMPSPAPKQDLKCNKFTFDATSSYDPAKQKLSFLWNFGDGNTSTEPVVTHIYEKGGEYNVTLTVKNDSGLVCDTSTTSQKVHVNTPPSAAFSSPEQVCVSDTVSFDASGTTDDTPGTLSYMWDFGDGKRGEGQKTSNTYAKGGTYNVTLTVNDNAGTACSVDSIRKVVKVNTSPVANAGGNVNMCLKSIDQEYLVAFDGSRSTDPDGDALSYLWSFGDGTTAQGAKVQHVYAKGGVYNVTLTVDDGKGLSCSRAMDTIAVALNKAPVAVAGGERKACVGQSVAFDGSLSKVEAGSKASYKWSFGDGQEATGEKVTHVYDKGGKYSVVLTVDDGKETACSKSADTALVHVNSRPVASLEKVENTCVGKTVSFNAAGSKDPDGDSLTYTWNFGDGTTEKGSSKATHVYEKGGNYTVSVVVDDGKDTSCSAASDSIGIKVNTPPSAKLNMVQECCVDMDQKFDASASTDADGDKLTYSWDLGDGTRKEGDKVTHAYSKPGSYKVVLRVDDGSGTECSSDHVVKDIVVSGNPVSVIRIR